MHERSRQRGNRSERERARRSRQKRRAELLVLACAVPIVTVLLCVMLYFIIDAAEERAGRKAKTPSAPQTNQVTPEDPRFPLLVLTGTLNNDLRIVHDPQNPAAHPRDMQTRNEPYLLVTLSNNASRPVRNYRVDITWSDNVDPSAVTSITLAGRTALQPGETVERRVSFGLAPPATGERRAAMPFVTAQVTGTGFTFVD